jgi:hypothetical protein
VLAIPETGISRSINEHNIDLDALCDWIEATVLFDENVVSQTQIVDTLCENHIYESQAFAYEMMANAWSELRRRELWLGGGTAMKVVGQTLERVKPWDDRPDHGFCISLSLAKLYPTWARSFGHDYTEQGALFEELTAAAIRILLSDWQVHSTGWTTTHTKKLNEIVGEVAVRLHEPTGDIQRWTKASANEAGLDLICYRTFDDGRAGLPVYLVQCASGGYEGKLHTPNLKIWKRIVIFTAEPRKAFSMPFSLTDGEFTRVCNLVDGMLLDRYRLLAPGRLKSDWLSVGLKMALVDWVGPRLGSLPRDS